MTLNLLLKSSLLKKWLTAQLGYFAGELFEFCGEAKLVKANVDKRIVIVAKKYYSEKTETLPSISKAELVKLLKLKKQSANYSYASFQYAVNLSVDGFDVRTITFDDELRAKLGSKVILIPETELLAGSCKNKVLACDTPAGLLYSTNLVSKSFSAYAKGLINNIEAFKLSTGVSDDVPENNINKADYPAFLFTAFTTLPINVLQQISLFDIKKLINVNGLHWLYAGPLITTLLFYVCINSYYMFSTYQIESELAQGGKDITSLLAQKRAIDRKEKLLKDISNEFKDTQLVHPYWQITEQLLKGGAIITRITYKKGEIIIRGNAEKASTLLAEINEFNLVENASFNGPVRSSRGKDVFILKIIPKVQA